MNSPNVVKINYGNQIIVDQKLHDNVDTVNLCQGSNVYSYVSTSFGSASRGQRPWQEFYTTRAQEYLHPAALPFASLGCGSQTTSQCHSTAPDSTSDSIRLKWLHVNHSLARGAIVMNTTAPRFHRSSVAPGEEKNVQPWALTKTISEEQPDQLCRVPDPSRETREDFGKV